MEREPALPVDIGDQFDDGSVRKIHMQKRDFAVNSPIITNQKTKAIAVECTSQMPDDFQQCVLYDEYGAGKKVPNIAFISYEVKNPFITSYKAQNGVVVNRVDFADVERCEIMGHNKNGLNLKCGLGFLEQKRNGIGGVDD
jgi:hypothetical protein